MSNTPDFPFGIGLCVNHRGSGDYTQQMQDRRWALDQLRPDWYHWWYHTDIRGVNDPSFMPCIEGTTIVTREQLQQKGLNRKPYTWILGNEFANPKPPHLTPEAAVEWMEDQLHEIRKATGQSVRVVAPNENINGTNLDWLDAFCIRARRRSMDSFFLGIHIYSPRADWLDYHWNRFADWRAQNAFSQRVIITECGPGAGATPETARQMLPHFLSLYRQNRWVRGIAAYAAWTATPVNEPQRYPGMLDQEGRLTEYGQAYLAEKSGAAGLQQPPELNLPL